MYCRAASWYRREEEGRLAFSSLQGEGCVGKNQQKV